MFGKEAGPMPARARRRRAVSALSYPLPQGEHRHWSIHHCNYSEKAMIGSAEPEYFPELKRLFLCERHRGFPRKGSVRIIICKGDAKHMKKSITVKWLSLVLCLALLAAASLSTVAFAETGTETAGETVILMNGTKEEPVVLGEGELSFVFEVIDPDANESWFEIHTDSETVGAALLENSLIAGSESEYGLYVTSVCGIELIWSEENPHYWAFYINGEYAQTGVDTTEAEEDALYLFKAE